MWLKMLALLAVLGLSLPLWGCVSTGKYEIKEKEARELAQNLQGQQKKYEDLVQENADLKARVKKIADDLAGVSGERDRFMEKSRLLGEALKSTADAKNQDIADLGQKISDLEKGNARLMEQLVGLRKGREDEVQKTSRTYEEMLEKMKSEIAHGQITISEMKGKLTVMMLNSLLFETDQAEVKPAGLEVLQKMVTILTNVRDKTIRVEGHTDNVPTSGELTRKYATNWGLSAARASNVARYLQQQGVDPALLSAVAYGEHKPAASNSTEMGKARNGRIEIILAPID